MSIPRSVPVCCHKLPHLLNTIAWFALLAVCVAGAQEGEEERKGWDYLDAQLSVADDFETPHTAWAKPYAGGTIRTLFFTTWYQGSTEGREIVEVMQRFDIDGQAAYIVGGSVIGDGAPDWYGGDPAAGTNRIQSFIDGGVDAFFVNQLAFETIPEPIRAQIRQRVEAGAGLVIVGEKAAPFDGASRLPATAALPAGSYFTLGKGRIAVLPSREQLIYTLGWETEFDYQMEQQGRALLWAAQREPQSRIGIRTQPVERSGLPAESIEITATGVAQGAALRVDLRRWDGERRALLAGAPPPSRFRVTLPKVRAGAYHVDCFSLRDGKVETWATKPLYISSPCVMDAVDLEQDWSEPGDAVAGRAVWSGDAPRDSWIELRLVDVRGRILQRETLHPSGVSTEFRVNVPRWAPMLVRVEAVLMDVDGEVSSAYTPLRVTDRKRHQFNFVMWNTPSGDLAPYGVESMVRSGITAFLQQGVPPLYVAAANASWVPYAASFRASSHTLTAMLDPETGLLRSGCVHDPISMQETVARVVDGVRAGRGHGVLAYSLGDENAVRGSCLGPDCLKAYRAYLERAYGTIDALNAEWNASYASFDDIALLAEGPLPAPDAPDWFTEYFADRQALERSDSEGAKDAALDRQIEFGNVNDEMRALQQGNFARWYDRQAFQCETYVAWCKQFQTAFREIDPQALTGFEGTDSFALRKLTTRSRQGGDLDAFVRELDYFGSYEGPGNEVMRSIAPKGFPMGSWIGYTPDVEELSFKFWQQVADRMNTIQWWRWDNLQGYNGYLAPNLAPFPAVREISEDTQVVRDGLGALITESDMEDDGVAMLYSMPSTHIAHFDGNETYGQYTRDHDRWHQLLHGEGLQFRYVTDRSLRLGEFDASRYKVLILPLALAMGKEEAEVIRAFVANGGTVIADLRPALYDGHCKPLDQGQLNDVFGIQQTGNRAARGIDRMNVDGDIAGQKIAMRWGNWHGKDVYPQMVVDPNVALATGKSMGQASFIHFWTGGLTAPQCIVNEFGKGRAVLLNFSVHDAPCAPLLRGLLAASGVSPALRVSTRDGKPMRDVEVSRWSSGDEAFAILLGTSDGDVQVAQPGLRHVYDLKRHEYLGHVDAFATTLRANRGSVFAFLPEPPEPPQVRVPESARRGTTVEAHIGIPRADGVRAITLCLVAPDGTVAGWIASPVVVHARPVTVTLPFAHNDPAGAWELRVADLYTHEMVSVPLTVTQ